MDQSYHAWRSAVVGLLAAALSAGAACHTPRPGASPASGDGCAPRDYWPTDGWRTSSPYAQGLDSARLAGAERWARDSAPQLFGILLVRHGYLVYEQYFHGHGPDELYDLRSATKSVTSALAGIAVGDGKLRVTGTVGDILPEHFIGTDSAAPQRRITVRDLLTMRSGIAWNEMHAPLLRPPSWVGQILRLPMDGPPGGRFSYSSANAHLVSAIIRRVTREPTIAMANARLFAPLGIRISVAQWPNDPEGNQAGGAGLSLSARDMAKFGYLYLNDGCWAGARVLPRGWVRESIRAWATPRGRDGTQYGYLWWLRPAAGHRTYYAFGYGGQLITVVPDLDLVVVTVGDASLPPDRALWRVPVVSNFVIPAVVQP